MKNRFSIKYFNVLFLIFFASTKLHSQIIKEYNECAVEKLNEGDIKGAIDFFSLIIQINPNDSFAYFDRGLLRSEIKNFIEAIQDFTKSISIDSSNVDFYFLRGIAYDKLHDTVSALQDYEKTIFLEEDNADAHYFIGLIKLNQNKMKEAIEEFEKTIRANSNHYKAYCYLGWSYLLSGHKKEALEAINRSLELDSVFSTAYFKRGFYEAESHNFRAAISNFLMGIKFRQTLELDKYPIEFAKNHQLKDLQSEVLKNWNEKLNTSYTELEFGILKIYLGLENEAMADFNSFIKNTPNHIEGIYRKALLEIKQSDYVSAEKDLNKVIEADTLYTQAYFYRAISRKNIKNYSGAINDLNKIIQLDAFVPDYYLLRAEIFESLGDKEKFTSDKQRYFYLLGK